MNRENKKHWVPDPVRVNIKKHIPWIEAEAKRRQLRDQRTARTQWQAGITKEAHHIGLPGEVAFAEYFGVHLDESNTYDRGFDFCMDNLRIDTKTTLKMEIPFVPLEKLKKQRAELFVFARKVNKFEIDLLGYSTRADFRRYCERRALRSGPNNYGVPRPYMEHMDDLKGSPGRSLFRYPGGKAKLMTEIFETSDFFGPLFAPRVYFEPFVGAGAMLGHFLDRFRAFSHVKWVLNDIDPAIVWVYRSIRDNLTGYLQLLADQTISVDYWEECKKLDGTREGLEAAVRKTILHYCSYGGFGAMAGGPQGGVEQKSDYEISCRYKLPAIARTAKWFSWQLQGATITNEDALTSEWPAGAFVAADPPYTDAGVQLYKHSFSQADHVTLAKRLRSHDGPWLVTYDDSAIVRELYAGCTIRPHYWQGGGGSRKHSELIITKADI